MFDDACYYLSFDNEELAGLLSDILNSELAQRFLRALCFSDAKRAVTIDLLQRLNLAVIARESGLEGRWKRAVTEINGRGYAATGAYQTEMLMERPDE